MNIFRTKILDNIYLHTDLFFKSIQIGCISSAKRVFKGDIERNKWKSRSSSQASIKRTYGESVRWDWWATDGTFIQSAAVEQDYQWNCRVGEKCMAAFTKLINPDFPLYFSLALFGFLIDWKALANNLSSFHWLQRCPQKRVAFIFWETPFRYVFDTVINDPSNTSRKVSVIAVLCSLV